MNFIRHFLSPLTIEAFVITGRGTVVVVDESLDVPGGVPIHVTITRQDGTAFDAIAFHQWMLRRIPVVVEKSALLLPQIAAGDIPIGATVTLR